MQISMFDGSQQFKIDKPIRLISLFSGYDSQALSLKYLGVGFEHYKTSEWAVNSIQALKDLHFGDDNTDYSASLTDNEVLDFLDGRISSDYSTPMTREQIQRKGEQWRRQVYNNMKASNNLGSITLVRGGQLEITDTDKYCYITTYSYPCQSLSTAGKQEGMAKGSGTRSSLLWEVERLLKETPNLPQVLLMENVPEVIGSKNIKHFAEWQAFLEKLGYKNKWGVLNGSDFNIPQNRERCFMVSVLGDYCYYLPSGEKLTTSLNDLLEDEVDEKYFLSDKQMIYAFDCNHVCDDTKRGDLADRWVNPPIAKTISCRGAEAQRADITNFVVGDNTKVYKLGEIRDVINLRSKNQHLKKIIEKIDTTETLAIDGYNQTLHKDCVQTIRANINTRNEDFLWKDLRIRKFTERECWRLMGVKDEDFERVAKNQTKGSLYMLAGNSIVTTVIMAILGNMLSIDYSYKINETIKEILNGTPL